MSEPSVRHKFIPKNASNEIFLTLKENRNITIHTGIHGVNARANRDEAVYGFFGDLFHLKYKIESVQSLKVKHLEAVFTHWKIQGMLLEDLQRKITIMLEFCEWIGKNGMKGNLSSEFKKTIRGTTI